MNGDFPMNPQDPKNPPVDRQSQGLFLRALLGLLQSLAPKVGWIALLLLALYLVSGVRTVEPNESGLILRFGKLQPKVHEPGLVIALPPPMDELIIVPTRQVHELELDQWSSDRVIIPEIVMEENSDGVMEGPEIATDKLHPVYHGYTMTGDANILQGEFTLRYHISDPVAWLRMRDNLDEILASLTYRSLAATLAARSVDAALTTEIEQVKKSVHKLVQQQCDSLNLGLLIDGFEIRSLNPAKQVVAAFESVNNAQIEARTEVESANAYRAQELPKVRTRAFAMRSDADIYAENLLARARGEAAAFRALAAQYQANPDLVRTRLLAESRETVLPYVQSTSIVPGNAGGSTYLLQPGSGARGR